MIRDDATLEELAMAIVASIEGRSIAEMSKSSLIVVSFYRVFNDGERIRMHFNEKVGRFRWLANNGMAVVEISDGRGGQRTKPKTPELVS